MKRDPRDVILPFFKRLEEPMHAKGFDRFATVNCLVFIHTIINNRIITIIKYKHKINIIAIIAILIVLSSYNHDNNNYYCYHCSAVEDFITRIQKRAIEKRKEMDLESKAEKAKS